MSVGESEESHVVTLIRLHDLGVVDVERAKSIEEISREIEKSPYDVERDLSILKWHNHVYETYSKDNIRKYYLTGRGILAACSYYS